MTEYANRIRFYEWLAGKLLVRSARLRTRRLGPNDVHELRHIQAAIEGGNSGSCGDGYCRLDDLAFDNYLDHIQDIHDEARRKRARA